MTIDIRGAESDGPHSNIIVEEKFKPKVPENFVGGTRPIYLLYLFPNILAVFETSTGEIDASLLPINAIRVLVNQPSSGQKAIIFPDEIKEPIQQTSQLEAIPWLWEMSKLATPVNHKKGPK